MDFVIVIGTSLKVAPVAEIPQALPGGVPQIYISREVSHPAVHPKHFIPPSSPKIMANTSPLQPAGHINFDVELLGDCDVVVTELCRRAGWDLKHEMIPQGQVITVEPVAGSTSSFVFKAVNPVVNPVVDLTQDSAEEHSSDEDASDDP